MPATLTKRCSQPLVVCYKRAGDDTGDIEAQEKFDPSISAEGRFRVYCRVANVTHVSTDRLNQILDKIGEGQGLSPKRRREIILESKAGDSQ